MTDLIKFIGSLFCQKPDYAREMARLDEFFTIICCGKIRNMHKNLNDKILLIYCVKEFVVNPLSKYHSNHS